MVDKIWTRSTSNKNADRAPCQQHTTVKKRWDTCHRDPSAPSLLLCAPMEPPWKRKKSIHPPASASFFDALDGRELAPPPARHPRHAGAARQRLHAATRRKSGQTSLSKTFFVLVCRCAPRPGPTPTASSTRRATTKRESTRPGPRRSQPCTSPPPQRSIAPGSCSLSTRLPRVVVTSPGSCSSHSSAQRKTGAGARRRRPAPRLPQHRQRLQTNEESTRPPPRSRPRLPQGTGL